MSVFSLEVSPGCPVTNKDLQDACTVLGVSIKDVEKKDYLNLLAVYHDSMAKLMAMEGQLHTLQETVLSSFHSQYFNPGRLHPGSRHRSLSTRQHLFPWSRRERVRSLDLEMQHLRQDS